jgi:hypothetical protein
VSGSRTVVTRGLSPLARHCAAYDSFELVRACLPALGSASRRRGRGCVPIDFCTPKPFNSSTRANRRFPALRPLIHTSAPFGVLHGNPTRTEPRGSCSFTRNVSFRALAFAGPKTDSASTGQLGPPDANEAGESRGSQRDSHFDGRASDARGRFLPPRATDMTVSGTSVASSVALGLAAFAEPTPYLGGRQDRFRGGLVTGVRFPDPRCLRPPDAPHDPPAR